MKLTPADRIAPRPAPSGRPRGPFESWGPRLACGCAVAVAALFHRLVPTDGDTPWHLARGRFLLRRWADGHLDLGRTDSFSWTARGRTWHPNSWGFDAVLAAFHDVGGWAGVAVLRVVLLTAIVALSWAASRRSGAGSWARATATWTSAVLLIPFSAARPQLATFVLLLICLELCARVLDEPGPGGTGSAATDRPDASWPTLVALAATVALWASLHGGVIVGVIAIATACAGHVFDRHVWRRPVLVTLVTVAASCASPLGPRVWSYAITVGGESRRELIQEWQPPSVRSAEDVAASVFLLLVVAWALVARRSGAPWARWRAIAPALVLTALAFAAVRNVPVAVLASVPLTAGALAGFGAWLDGRGWSLPVHPGRALGAMSVGALLGGAIQTGGFSLRADPLASADYPSVSAHALPSGCRLLNEYADGGYLILVRPDVPVSQDGRNDLYGHARLREQESLLATGDPATAAAELDRRGITCVLAAPSRALLQALAETDQWHRVAADKQAEAWVRSPGSS